MSKYPIKIKPSIVDKTISIFSPRAALDRYRAKIVLQCIEGSGFITGGSSRKSMRGWNPTANSADEDIIPTLENIRASARDLTMNTCIASGAVKRVNTNAVGYGLTLQSRIDREFLRISDEQADSWERSTEREFRLWASRKWCDSTKTQNFYEMQGTALYNMLLSGDVFALLPYQEDNSQCPYRLRVKLVEADEVTNPYYSMDTRKLAGGIEINEDGAPVAYYFRKFDIDTQLSLSSSIVTKWEKISAYGESGRINVVHLYKRERPGQRRGISLFAPVIEILKQMSRLTEAELAAAVIASFFTVFVKTTSGTGGLIGSFPVEESIKTTAPGDTNIYEMGSGNVLEMNENQSIDVADPKRPNGAFEPFYLSLVKQIGCSLEIPFEQLMLYFSASYSAARGAILEAWKFYRMKRMNLADGFCQPIYEEFLLEGILLGRIIAPGFLEDPLYRQAWSGSKWSGPGQGQIDPMKETQAALLKIEGNLSTNEDEVIGISGENWDNLIDRKSREVTKLNSKGLPVYTSKQAAVAQQPQGEGVEV